jgi:hypothetical protein
MRGRHCALLLGDGNGPAETSARLMKPPSELPSEAGPFLRLGDARRGAASLSNCFACADSVPLRLPFSQVRRDFSNAR